jgi:Domain of unknown function (DUF4286)
VIRYEVVLEPVPDLTGPLERWMRATHIPDVLATGCFRSIHFDRSGHRLRTVYIAATRTDLERYLAHHAEPLRADFARHFPHGVTVAREVWDEVERWSRDR